MTVSTSYAEKPTPDRALIWLFENPSGATTGQIARALNVTTRSAGMALMRLNAEGWVEHRPARETQDVRGRRWHTKHWKVRR